ncbi:MAG: helicase C-terminal domain-containing protein [Bacteroidota bacterium]
MEHLRSTVEHIFSPSGTLAQRKGYEHRPQQEEMAAAVASALEERSHLIVEAPTGVGKTLAYLVPALLYALERNQKAIVSTHTKNLQEQLIQKDIPIARSLIGKPVVAATLKGRRNYLCTTRLAHAVASPSSMFDLNGAEQLARIQAWASHTPDGDMEGLDFSPRPDVWEMVCSEQGTCSSGVCGQRCFFQRAKVRAREAHLLILNHALFFSLFAINESEDHFIFPDDFVIFDEAHTLEAVAGAGLGLKLSRRAALLALHRIYNPKTKKGLLGGRRRKPVAIFESAEAAIDEFFGTISRAARALAPPSGSGYGPRQEIRIRAPGVAVNAIDEPFLAVESFLKQAEEKSADLFQSQELASARRSLQEVRTSVQAFLDQTGDQLTYWVELPPSGNVMLVASPSDVGEVLGPRLFREQTPVIMTSATLSVNGSLDYFRARVGADDATPLILGSPFDHSRQMTLCLARDVPEPDSDAHAQELPGWILRSIERTQGKALVLFTSAAMMRSAAATLAPELSERGIRMMVQGIDGQRHELLENFKEDISSVLFGLDSFWMGVDVPGEALEHVIITRLPFAAPNHPLIEARLEAIAARGGNSFLEYVLPEAVLKFKQGAGRLIRTRDDKGVVTVLDSRILHKSYGRAFISSLPRCPVEILGADGETTVVEPSDQ